MIAKDVGRLAGRNLVLDRGVCAMVSAAWETPLSGEELYRAFLSIVRALGFVAVENGATTRIMLDENAPTDPEPGCRHYPVM